MTPAPTNPRYTGPVLVDPAQNGRKLVPDYANPWGRKPQDDQRDQRQGLLARLLRA